MILGIVNINSCVTLESSRKNCLMIIELVADKILLYVVNKHGYHLFTMCSYFNKFIYCYRSGTVNWKSFVDKVLLRIKWKFELTVYFRHRMLGK